MQARSALFDLYGDYLRPRGGRAPVAALVRLLAPLGIAAPAVRTAVSRMVRQGWLHPLRLSAGPGLPAHAEGGPPARRGRAPGSTAPAGSAWDGRFDLLVLDAAAGAPRAAAARRQPDLPRLRHARPSAPGSPPAPGEEVDGLLDRGRRAVRAVHRQPRRRHRRRRRRWSAGPGTCRDRRRVRAVRRRAAPAAGRGRPPAATTSRRTRPGSGSCTRGARSCSATRSCRRRCCPSAGPAPTAAAFFDRHADAAAAGRRPLRRPLPRRAAGRPTEGSVDT